MTLVRLERLMVGELHVDGATAHLRRISVEARHNRGGRYFVGHLEERLVLALEHQHVGDAAKGDAQLDDLRFGGLVGDVADVNDARRFACGRKM